MSGLSVVRGWDLFRGGFGGLAGPGDCVTLNMLKEVEDIDVEPPESIGERSLRQLFESGEIVEFQI